MEAVEEETPLFGWPDPPHDPAVLSTYLGRILHAARLLAGQDNPSTVVTDPAAAIHEIAQALVQACRPELIALDPLIHLPEIPIFSNEKELPIPEEPDQGQDDTYNLTPYQMRRVDYLRDLLRTMVPIQLDVAVAAVDLLSSSSREETSATAVILFGQWLYVAPHITPLVSAVLRGKPCPLEFLTGKESAAERFTLVEACHRLCAFYCRERLEWRSTLLHLWDWSSTTFDLLPAVGDCMALDVDWRHWQATQLQLATDWHAVRMAALLLSLAPVALRKYLRQYGVEQTMVPWQMHPWDMNLEEGQAEKMVLRQTAEIWQQGTEFDIPTAEHVRQTLSLPSCLVDCGRGIVLIKENPLGTLRKMDINQCALVRTATTQRNLSLLGAILGVQPQPPILVCGQPGSGKSTLIRELAKMVGASLLEIHVDDETDSKMLIGCTTTTEIPGRFEWRPGALTKAVRQGRWVLLEDLDRVPFEIQAALVQLLENRLLPLGNGQVEKAHPSFRLFSTHGPKSTVGRKILGSHCWALVPIELMTMDELKEVARFRFTNLPDFVVDTVLSIFNEMHQDSRVIAGCRLPSVRDLFKALSRISRSIPIDKDTNFATEGQRTLCLGETMDVFAAACPDVERRRNICNRYAEPAWKVSADLAKSYLERRIPEVIHHPDSTQLGRVRLSAKAQEKRAASPNFATTGHALRFIESIAVCVRENEPVLLVGETGGGKTTLVQQLALLTGRQVVVQNLSLQTDSTDLLGGFRPLEMKHVARRVYQEFVDLFTGTFSRKQNSDFLRFTQTALKKEQWKKLSQCFQKACKLGLNKVRERQQTSVEAPIEPWNKFVETAERFEQQRLACDSGLAFEFTEGGLVEAIRSGKWVLLDEINLASSEILQRLCGLLDTHESSIILTERGDSEAINRHPNFRLFAAMNPATDSGKKDLPPSIRSRFTEIYVDEILDPVELRTVVVKYISPVLTQTNVLPEETEVVGNIVDLYLRCRDLAETSLVDGAGHKPRYTLRTLSRALTAAQSMILKQKFSLKRGLVEGFELAFQGSLDERSSKEVNRVIESTIGEKIENREQPGRRPGGSTGAETFILLKPFWVEKGPRDVSDWAEQRNQGLSRYVLTPTTSANVRQLARVIASGPWPVLLEGPTSAGKTSVVGYIAARCGHEVVRINNHEHTDIQEYLGGFAPDENGSLVFQDGLLVQALRRGHWVILDELNLAPSEVLEALNRLLDDNRELYLPETNEIIKAHRDFRIFATQNPSGAYGGRKPLSKAFRNRFIEIHVGDIPIAEMAEILQKKSGCPPSHSKILVAVMDSLRQRRSTGNLFAGKDSLITPRDLLRWADRKATSKRELAEEGYMLLAERLRTEAEKNQVQEVIEKCSKVSIDVQSMYYSSSTVASQIFERIEASVRDESSSRFVQRIAPTKPFLRLVTLVERCFARKEPVLLVGDTGCGKTTAVQLVSVIRNAKLDILNCHATTETSDLLGNLRPVRGREAIEKALVQDVIDLRDRVVTLLKANAPFSILNIPDTINPGSPLRDLYAFANTLRTELKGVESELSREAKRQRTSRGDTSPSHQQWESEALDKIEQLFVEIEKHYSKLQSIFEWSDGQLVRAMKEGSNFLLDEISLAEDAVIERLNSVLEPSRSLVLAEKTSCDDTNTREIVADPDFQLFATMNPGGDFGKKELSPALRSRFTEIWVTPITESSDIDLVLHRLLTAEGIKDPVYSPLKTSMMEYFEWFNQSICLDRVNPREELILSVRDLVAWARFVSESSQMKNVGVWDAYLHGAFLMHLDGLGLGTVLADFDVQSIKRDAITFLKQQLDAVGGVCVRTDFGSPSFVRQDGKFGFHPFWIPEGRLPISTVQFDFKAPTTASNLSRVLRAMQLSKPILLEGSPGVGKTTLVAALAKASGHSLVRINLSEQTDMSDLIGSDLPTEGDNQEPGATFQWSDGALLLAIKSGDWVLLDELNLASQSVLEGLNSVLDHRATVYVPELGQSVVCPPSFRVFAAQNPLGQGGGRKGLPKSFLNRFTKVYVDGLSEQDMTSIATKRFDSIPPTVTEKLVSLNSRVDRYVSVEASFGQKGAPWEFNLRDVFRMCSVLSVDSRGNFPDLLSYVQDLYLKRFRCWEDRETLATLHKEVFSGQLELLNLPELRARDGGHQLGTSFLPSSPTTCIELESDKYPGGIPFYLRGSAEALVRCIENRWPCLLILNSCPEGSSLVDAIGSLASSNVRDIALTPASDVSELIGSFEQVGHSDHVRRVVVDLIDVLSGFLLEIPETGRLITKAQTALVVWDETLCTDSLHVAYNVAKSLRDFFASKSLSIPPKIIQILEDFDRYLSKRNDAGGSFTWKDGILVDAMLRGDWVHLRNANLCPASVLDRLNSVLEPDCFLLLSECGASEEHGKAGRIIRAHPNFRIILSLDPEYGEISRAMRNRCVELSLLPNPDSASSSFQFDQISCFTGSGIRTSALGSIFMRGQHTNEGASEIVAFRCLAGLLRLGCSRTTCGWMVNCMKCETVRTGNGTGEKLVRDTGILCTTPVWRGENSKLVDEIGAALSLQVFYGWKGITPSLRNALPPVVQSMRNPVFSARHSSPAFFKTCEWESNDLRHDLLFWYWLASPPHRCCSTFKSLRQGSAQTLLGFFAECSHLTAHTTIESGIARHLVARLASERLKWKAWVAQAGEVHGEESSPLYISLLLSEGRIEASTVSCKITPFLYPFFVVMDQWISYLFQIAQIDSPHLAKRLTTLIDELEGTRTLLLESASVRSGTNLFTIPPDTFEVSWKWLKKAILGLAAVQPPLQGRDHTWRELDGLMTQIDGIVFPGNKIGLFGMRKCMPQHVVPHSQNQWSDLLGLKELGSKCVMGSGCPPDTSSIELPDLLSRRPTTLCAPVDLKRDIIAAIATVQAAQVRNTSFFSLATRTSLFAGIRDRFEGSLRDFKLKALAAETQFDEDGHENEKSVQQLEDIMSSAEQYAATYKVFNDFVLHKFSDFQIAQSHEFVYEKLELYILRQVCCIIARFEPGKIQNIGSQLHLKNVLEDMVDAGATKLQWDLEDFMGFQVAHWALTASTDDETVRILNDILPTLRFYSARRIWRDPLLLKSVVSPLLMLPSPLEAPEEVNKKSPPLHAFKSNALHSSVFALMDLVHSPGTTRAFRTIENFEARENQARILSRLLVKDEMVPPFEEPWDVSLMVVDVLEALSRREKLLGVDDALQQIRCNGFATESCQQRLVDQIYAIHNVSLKSVLLPTLIPLLQSLRCAWSSENNVERRLQYAVSLVFGGLLRFHFYLPDSPTDPSRKPASKARLLRQKADRIHRRRIADRLRSGLSSGCVDPKDYFSVSLDGQHTACLEKATKLEGMVMERVDRGASFYSLFVEVHELAESILSVDNVIQLCESIRSKSKNAMTELENWQTTSKAFSVYAVSKYAAFSDVIDPLVETVGTVECGLRQIPSLAADKDREIKYLLKKQFQLPRETSVDTLQELLSTLHHLVGLTSEARTSRGLVLIALSYLIHASSQQRTRTEKDTQHLVSAIIKWIMVVSLPSFPDRSNPAATDEEMEEMEFRKQFPNHWKDFHFTLDDAGSVDSKEENLPPQEETHSRLFFLGNTEYRALCDTHDACFRLQKQSREGTMHNAFRCQYVAALELAKDGQDSSLNVDSYSCQIMALALSAGTTNKVDSAMDSPTINQAIFDFHHDPDPEQAKKAAKPLENVAGRVMGLLHAFPGNAVLLSIAKVVDRVRKLDINKTPTGKIMVGLELVLKHSQDWEQHSSERTRIGDSLKTIGSLVAAYRRLELHSWPGLLHWREKKFRENAKTKWVDLYWLLNEQSRIFQKEDVHDTPASFSYLSPRWVWHGKEIRRIGNDICFKTKTESLPELAKTLDTFLLTSPLGEFSTRLDMMGAFSGEMKASAEFHVHEGRLQLARVINALYLYYGQFSSFLSAHILEVRQPFEKRLRDEVKLAKWDEQSYYALASSSEKSHRKLMMILREFDESLETTVAVVLEKELQRGVRLEDGVPTDTVPPFPVLFPLASPKPESYIQHWDEGKQIVEPIASLNVVSGDLGEFVSQTHRYAKRMQTILDSDKTVNDYSLRGCRHTNELCAAIFERIDSLRSPKTTRPMKERSLVDLFKELKQHGYSALKWSTPQEMRQFAEIIRLPCLPNASEYFNPQIADCAKSAEGYFLRCTAELNRLQGEVQLVGQQQHMTQRQTEHMVSFCVHGMFLLSQQRSILSYSLTELLALQRNVEDICQSSRSLPYNQLELSRAVATFEIKCTNLIDTVIQVKILLQELQTLRLDSQQASRVRDLLVILEELLKQAPDVALNHNILILGSHLELIDRITESAHRLADKVQCFASEFSELMILPTRVLKATVSAALEVTEAGKVCYGLSSNRSSNTENGSLDAVVKLSTELVDYCRLATQVCLERQNHTKEDSSTIWNFHRLSTEEINEMKLERLRSTSSQLLLSLRGLQDEAAMKNLLPAVGSMCYRFVSFAQRRISEYITFYRGAAKFHYILLRIFRVLIAKGFCTIESEEKDGDGEGDVAGMKFEDNDGTGMGEGEGSRDVTDQIEDEEQLLGLKSDGNGDEEKSEKPGKLEKEEADTGLEMENDFEGELFDVPSDEDNHGSDDEDGKEEVDREMGDDSNPNEEIIDKKLWDGEEDEQGDSQENLDRGGSLEGEVVDDEMITNDEQKEESESNDQNLQGKNQDEHPNDATDGIEDEAQDEILEDSVEENNPMNARDDRAQDEMEEQNGEGDMDLSEDIELDNGEEAVAEESMDLTEDGATEEISDDNSGAGDEKREDASDQNEENESLPDLDESHNVPTQDVEITDQVKDDQNDESESDEAPIEQQSAADETHEGLGVRARDGKDRVQNPTNSEVPPESEVQDGAEEEGESGDPQESGGTGQHGESRNQGSLGHILGTAHSAGDTTKNKIPNPFKSPGDIEKFWHKKLNILQNDNKDTDEEAMDSGDTEDNQHNAEGQYEHVKDNQASTTQALGDAENEDLNEIADNPEMEESKEPGHPERQSSEVDTEPLEGSRRDRVNKGEEIPRNNTESMEVDDVFLPDETHLEEKSEESASFEDTQFVGNDERRENRIASDISRLSVDADSADVERTQGIVEDFAPTDRNNNHDDSRSQWNTLAGEVHGLSRRMCEKLRLVLEPLVATKLRGDYRTGKRINMKRVIGFIASGYRKDKIWLRRTKPCKRNYRVLVAVDDSESMATNGAGHIAMKALATLSNGMSQLEIGEIGIAKFGDDMQMIHPFGSPFTSESGANLMRHFNFDQARTRTALCVESALLALEEPGDVAPMQLVLLISDGKIERDNKSMIRRLVREMLERNILMALIIVEGEAKKDNILNMKEVAFENGKPRVRSFMEDYPFPYYIILEDLATLPETLGDALRQWFEMIGRINSSA